MKHLVTILILTLTLHSFGQRYQFDEAKISGHTKKIVSTIAKENMLMGSAVGFGAVRPEQFDNFTELQKLATKIELQELTNHPNAVVRCYSFWALSYDSSFNLLPLLINHISDEENVKTQFGCIISREKAGDFFIHIANPGYMNESLASLTPSEYEYLDSLLVYTPNNLNAKEKAISRVKLNETSYKRVRALVLKENNQSALVTLARFNRQQDIPLILNNNLTNKRYNRSFSTYQAISVFPDNSFLPLLKTSLYEALDKERWSTEWSGLYKAIASFKNDTAYQLLKLPFTQTKNENIRQYHIDFIFEAIQKFYTPIYEELLWTMWEREKKINSKVFKLLYASNPDKAFQLTKKTIQNADDFYYLNTMVDSEDEETSPLLDSMLDTLLNKDRTYAIEVINKNIQQINVHQFPIFADKALKIKDPSFVESFFKRLSVEDNPHVYLKATEVLIALKDEEINKRIVKVAATNPDLRKDWGGREFDKLLKENSIE